MIRAFLKKIYYILNGRYTSGYLLNEYGKKYKTDKINEHHSFAGKNYLDIYDLYLREIKDELVVMLEIGIREGSSLRTFRDYFKNGQIIGLDINPETAFSEERIETFIGSQSSSALINAIIDKYKSIDVVLDDGSHVNELTIASFDLLIDKVSPGGFYIIEDLACSYLEDQLASDIIEGGWPGMSLNDASVQMVNRRSDMDTFFQKIIKDLDYRRGDIEYIHFWSQLCVIKKKK
jgi:cephalosporin hydroxylase